MVSFKSLSLIMFGLFIFLAIGLMFFGSSDNPTIVGIKDSLFDDRAMDKIDPPAENFGRGESAGASSGGSSGSSDGSSETPSNSSCYFKQISYSMKKFSESFECLNSNANECIELTATCSVEIQNLDSATPIGVFRMSYSLINNITSTVIDFANHDRNLSSMEVWPVVSIFNLANSSGVEENLACSPLILEIPKKEICV